MQYKKELKDEIFQDWPAQYYDLDPETRRSALARHMADSPGFPGDERRKEILERRFSGKGDQYFYAWMMLKVLAQESVSFLNRKRHMDEIRRYFRIFDMEHPDEIQIQEWKNFADTMIRNYSESPAFRAAVFGMGSVGDRNTAFRIASEIIEVTEKVPDQASMKEAVTPFASVMKEQFLRLIPDAEEILAKIQSR